MLSYVGSGLERAHPPCKECYQLSIRIVISEFILDENRPQSVIRQGINEEEEEEEEDKS
jgi:hypothetical protein